MRTIAAVVILAGVTFVPRCATRTSYSARESADAMEATGTKGATETVAKVEPALPVPVVSSAPADPFRETIRPILSARCGECHDPGGKMHARLPFDDPKVVSSNSAGILRRLKGEDRAALEKWVAGLAAATDPR
jgi:hypothetical protein